MSEIAEQIGIPPWALVAAAAGVALLAAILLFFVVRRWRRRVPEERASVDLSIDVATLGEAGPPPTGPSLELYNVPMRLAAIVVAPAGLADADAPISAAAVLDQIVPGARAVLGAHRPVARQWPAQRSAQGFASAFFKELRLPGERGKGTPWCAVAGRCEVFGRKVLVGLVLRAEAANNFSLVVVERETGWLDVLRARTG